jgi:hypothetical protein
LVVKGVVRDARQKGVRAVATGFIEDMKLTLRGHALQCFEYIGVPHVIDGDIQRMFRTWMNLTSLKDSIPTPF